MAISRVRRAFLAPRRRLHAGRTLSDAELDALDQLDDVEALADRHFPTLTPPSVPSSLWALGLSVRALAPRFSNDFERPSVTA